MGLTPTDVWSTCLKTSCLSKQVNFKWTDSFHFGQSYLILYSPTYYDLVSSFIKPIATVNAKTSTMIISL